MALAARLEIRQGQGLVITPQLQQAIKLLQLSNLELEAFVEAELEKNPLLAREEREGEPRRPRPAATLRGHGVRRGAGRRGRAPTWSARPRRHLRRGLARRPRHRRRRAPTCRRRRRRRCRLVRAPATAAASTATATGIEGALDPREDAARAPARPARRRRLHPARARHRPGADRRGGRGRLSARRRWPRSPTGWAAARRWSRRCWRAARASSRPASSPATCANA